MSNEDLVKQIQNGFNVTDNMQTLYENNMPLIRACVKPYTAYESMEDLLQQAYFGLLQAVQRFDTEMEVKFMTYASYWIKQEVVRYIEDNGRCVRIPSHFRGLINRYKKTVDKFIAEHNKKPDMEQIQRLSGLTEKQIYDIEMYMQDIKSLDEPVGANTEGEAYSLSDVLSDNTDIANDIVEQMTDEELKRDIWYAVDNCLSDRQREIMYLSYKHNQTLDAIGQSLGITRERVRQLKAAGLRKLRIGEAKRLLIKYVEADTLMYKGNSMDSFEHYGSTVERTAIRRISVEEWINAEVKRRMAE